MKTITDMQPQLSSLCEVLEKYTRISKMPLDFGVQGDLYPAEIHMISTVARQGPSSISEIAGGFGHTKGAASQMVAKLVKRGLLSKQADPAKRSRMVVRVTEQGRIAHRNHMEFHQRHDKAFLAYLGTLGDEQYQTFAELCSNMNRWMDSYLAGPQAAQPKERTP